MTMTTTKQTTTTDATAAASEALAPLVPWCTECPDVLAALARPLEALVGLRHVRATAAATARSLCEEMEALGRRAAALALDERLRISGAAAALQVVEGRQAVVGRRVEAEHAAGEEARRRGPERRAALEDPLAAVGLVLVRALEAQRDTGITQLCAEGASMPMDERLAVVGLARGAYGCANDFYLATRDTRFKRMWDLDERLGAAARLVRQPPMTPKPAIPRPWARLLELVQDTPEEATAPVRALEHDTHTPEEETR